MSHTKGPWNVGGDIKMVNDPTIYRNVWGPTPEGMQSGHQVCRHATKDDAALIAAAPEMLSMLRTYAGECGECDGSAEEIRNDSANKDPADDYAVPCDACKEIWALISKAEGGAL